MEKALIDRVPPRRLSAVLFAVALLALAPWTLVSSAAAESDPPRPSIGLALGSGGAGGLAHIAMLEVFETLSLQPAAISGSSIGAENGASWTDLLDLGNDSILDADGFLEFVGERIEAREFSELVIPLKIVATDYWTGETVTLEEGDLFEAIKASMAVPGLFAPVEAGDRLLIDGGVSNPLPWDVLGDHDVVVAIDVTGVREPSPEGAPGITELLFKSFEIMQQSLIGQMRAATPPDLYLKPALEDIRLLHFDRVDEVLSQAQPAAKELHDRLQELISSSR